MYIFIYIYVYTNTCMSICTYLWISNMTHMNKSRDTYEWYMWRIWMSHVTHMNHVTHEWGMWHYNTTTLRYNPNPTLQMLPHPTPTNLQPLHITHPCAMKFKNKLWLCLKLWPPCRREEWIAPPKTCNNGSGCPNNKTWHAWMSRVMWRKWMESRDTYE